MKAMCGTFWEEGGREDITDKYGIDEWKVHFMKGLGDTEKKPKRKDGELQELEEPTDGELLTQFLKLKRGKAAGVDGVKNEV